jgi:hypothetical protein
VIESYTILLTLISTSAWLSIISLLFSGVRNNILGSFNFQEVVVMMMMIIIQYDDDDDGGIMNEFVWI